ncbi:hypothetical protein OJ997_18140 [Solirubrobacter phytolaccae]|uniref:WD40 repeat domain-containing protein n=1 Tax=Solirubrobacter phytolaccae TaxID=1404360 RepID=A0A9X3NJ32_9ACTN|nr:hypothetical protein [Solirubrobacter phytolaccae]
MGAWLAAAAPASAALKVIDVQSGKRSTLVKDSPAEGWTSLEWTADGSALIGVANESLGEEVEVRRYPVAGGRGKLLRRLPDAFDAVLSPGGTRVAALYDHGQGLRGDRGGVVIRDVASGRRLAKLPQFAEGDDLYESSLNLTWSRDGTRVAYFARERKGETLRVADAASGRILRRLDGKGLYGVSFEAFSPAGDRLVYAGGSTGWMRVLDIASGKSHRLGINGSREAWAPAGERIAVASGEEVVVSGEDQRFGTPVAAGENVEGIVWSPDGTQLAVVLRSYNADSDTALALMTPGQKPRMLIPFRKRGIFGLEWSPDSRRIAYED